MEQKKNHFERMDAERIALFSPEGRRKILPLEEDCLEESLTTAHLFFQVEWWDFEE